MAAAREAQVQTQAQAEPRHRQGALVALEGIDGSGKSSLAAQLHKLLQEKGIAAVLTREPTGSWLGQAVKRAIREASDPFVEAFLFLADHAEHVREVQAWLAQGSLVVSDRYGDSCLAYQAAALEPLMAQRGRSALEWLTATQAPVTRAPDVCLLLDLPSEEALARIRGRAEVIKYEEPDFLAKVRRNYLDLAKRTPTYEVLDASQPLDKLRAQAWQALVRRGVAPP